MFRTQFKRLRKETNAGSPIRIIKAGQLDKGKNLKVVEKGKENFYAYINSFADSVDINVLLARFANGDKEALLQRAGAFIDISALPTNINEFIELYHNGETYFNSLPIEIKEKFNNNMTEFISKIGDKEWLEIMNTSPADIKQEKLDLIKENKALLKDAAKVQFNNSVYGEIPIDKPIDEITPIDPEPIIERSKR